jgi:hypothetical protein
VFFLQSKFSTSLLASLAGDKNKFKIVTAKERVESKEQTGKV